MQNESRPQLLKPHLSHTFIILLELFTLLGLMLLVVPLKLAGLYAAGAGAMITLQAGFEPILAAGASHTSIQAL